MDFSVSLARQSQPSSSSDFSGLSPSLSSCKSSRLTSSTCTPVTKIQSNQDTCNTGSNRHKPEKDSQSIAHVVIQQVYITATFNCPVTGSAFQNYSKLDKLNFTKKNLSNFCTIFTYEIPANHYH